MEKKEYQQITLESSLKTICFPNGNTTIISLYIMLTLNYITIQISLSLVTPAFLPGTKNSIKMTIGLTHFDGLYYCLF